MGDVVVGTVQAVKPYGAFIDVGGLNGLLHISQISHDRVTNVENVLSEGDKLKVCCALRSVALSMQPFSLPGKRHNLPFYTLRGHHGGTLSCHASASSRLSHAALFRPVQGFVFDRQLAGLCSVCRTVSSGP